MSKKESRRIVPVSAVAIAAFTLLIVFEVLVIGGVIRVKAATVARIAPWAYEPFLKLVGEHPESKTLKESVLGRKDNESGTAPGMASVAGFNPDGFIINLDVPAEEDEAVDAEGVFPDANPSNAVPEGSAITNPVPDHPADVVPVG